ncbi:MAG: hypothetical protein ACREA9_03900 [Pyrinomonadaceae bacterium]
MHSFSDAANAGVWLLQVVSRTLALNHLKRGYQKRNAYEWQESEQHKPPDAPALELFLICRIWGSILLLFVCALA